MTNLGLKVIKAAFLLTILIALSAMNVGAQNDAPPFKDYPVAETFTGKTAPLVLTSDSRMFRTRLRVAAKGKPNFAGHFILTSWGCGAECLITAVIDMRTGNVAMFPPTICCWEMETPIDFHLNSSLVVFTGMRDEKEGDNGKHFYKFENGRFVHIKSIPSRS